MQICLERRVKWVEFPTVKTQQSQDSLSNMYSRKGRISGFSVVMEEGRTVSPKVVMGDIFSPNFLKVKHGFARASQVSANKLRAGRTVQETRNHSSVPHNKYLFLRNEKGRVDKLDAALTHLFSIAHLSSEALCEGGNDYRANSITLFSLITFTLISPGYFNSASIFPAISRASFCASTSVTCSGRTKIRISRPA